MQASPAGQRFTCWNGEVVRGAFVLGAHDREIIAWRAVTSGGISGSDVRDLMRAGRRGTL